LKRYRSNFNDLIVLGVTVRQLIENRYLDPESREIAISCCCSDLVRPQHYFLSVQS